METFLIRFGRNLSLHRRLFQRRQRVRAFNGTGYDRHLRLALRVLARAVLPEGVAAEEATRILRGPVSHDRIERRFLPHAYAGSSPKLGGTNRGGLCLCLEGIAIHYALEAPFRELGQ